MLNIIKQRGCLKTLKKRQTTIVGATISRPRAINDRPYVRRM